jgi:ribosome maturation factor RimP
MIEERIYDRISPELAAQGYSLVKVNIDSGDKFKTLRIMAERGDYKSLDISDCQKITKFVSDIFEEEDIISGAYNLEVSSPGLDRPLINKQDFIRFDGFVISLKSKSPINGSKKFKGRSKVEGEKLSLYGNDGDVLVEISLSDIESAKIVVTDELLKSKGKIN